LHFKSFNEKKLREISAEIKLSFECKLITYSPVTWRKAYKGSTR